MDNFPQENEDTKIEKNNSKDSQIEDIQFDDSLDLDTIEKKLIEKIENNDDDDENENVDELLEIKPELESFNPQNQITDIEPTPINEAQIIQTKANAKKYVIYIDSDNIDFVENLSIQDRRIIINKILKEQNEIMESERKAAARNRFFKHLTVAVITFLIAFPVIFMLANASTELTITNYREAKKNFEKLYKQGGKIKQHDSDMPTSIKY